MFAKFRTKMENQEPITTTRTKKRPTFLTILCILSFIGIGLAILSSILTYISTQAITGTPGLMEKLSSIDEQTANPMFKKIYASGVQALINAKLYALLNILANVICLIGVVMMWKLKKPGFFIYTLGELGTPVLSIILIGNVFAGTFLSAMGLIGNAVGFIFPVAFIVMYALNLKHMT